MEMSGEYKIKASRQQVWDALNDPEILKQSIPGCEEIIQSSPTQMAAKVTAKVGPVKAKFAGEVELSDLDPPNGYRISGEGKGGAAGFAKGGANVVLEEDSDGTILKYEVDAQVGGKLAQLGARLIDGTAKKMASQFFENFAAAVEEGNESVDETAAAPAAAAPTSSAGESTSAMSQIGMGTWIIGAVVAAVILAALLS
ncbi:MAG: carbon monoxide dehydrogenase subunit G [Alphaproteobacteria bacterium]|nr:carbon monoxide dehydrogenase subunit G [Alphaproteobacteria bacterium]